MAESRQKFTAVVLAADRTSGDPVSRAAGAACKAFVPIHGTPMIVRVIDALQGSGMIERILLCGPSESLLPQCPRLLQRLQDGAVQWLPNRDSPARSADYCLRQLDDDAPVLLTTADHALLTPEMVRYFLDRSLEQEADAVVGVVDFAVIEQAFPGVRRTVTRLRGGGVCGCNLFALLSREGRGLAARWRRVERRRKRPWQWIARQLGPVTVLAYLFGRLTLERGLAVLSRRSGIRIRAVRMPYPRAGVDVDTPEDLQQVERILAAEEGSAQASAGRAESGAA